MTRPAPTRPLLPTHVTTLGRVAPVAIFTTGLDGRVIYTSERWSEISGMSAASSRGDGWANALHPDDRARVFEAWRTAAVARTEYNTEYQVVRPSGEVRYVHARGVPVLTAHGRLAGFVGTVEDVTERAAAELALASVSKRLVEVQELERRDIARELHDEIGQLLTGLKLRLDLVRRDAPAALSAPIQEGIGLIEDLMARVRRLAVNLRPPLLDEFGLPRALAAQFERFSGQTAVEVVFRATGLSRRRLPLEIETTVYRIIQESLTNVARHAGVRRAEIALRVRPRSVGVVVTDRGRGFDVDTAASRGAGLVGMQERAMLLGGTFSVRSSRRGTKITAELPVRARGGRR